MNTNITGCVLKLNNQHKNPQLKPWVMGLKKRRKSCLADVLFNKEGYVT